MQSSENQRMLVNTRLLTPDNREKNSEANARHSKELGKAEMVLYLSPGLTYTSSEPSKCFQHSLTLDPASPAIHGPTSPALPELRESKPSTAYLAP